MLDDSNSSPTDVVVSRRIFEASLPASQNAIDYLEIGACRSLDEAQAYWDDLKFEVVGKDVPITGMMSGATRKRPQNLDFGN